ncbi:Lysophospholipase L1 [Reichenbachiella faecimaris]|uniref:Lysophospholipase L1 n=1 Tax=Reichenbachiella faecimaris TaxID=692418 RepID=A0A1W2G7K7_REIFA|nr:rhamnogalacturonan acetylesterase [Reichenbachiella faecimaris]SMD32276.1 Lysophospholipase L1 [Reichenbachiella faecimaris]
MKTLYYLLIACQILLATCISSENETAIYLIGDSTVADYSGNYDEGKDYYKTRFPLTGWGQVFQGFFLDNQHSLLSATLVSNSFRVINKARGGRSTRTFFQEGRWRKVYDSLRPGDLVIMQFGHNDASEQKPLRYVNLEGYGEFLRLYVRQSRDKQAIPIILTPVARNYPWEGGHLQNVHGKYPDAAKSIAEEMNVLFIDLNQLSMDAFSAKGQDYVTNQYFMNFPAGLYEAYPEGQSDNTHFQPEGAEAVAKLVYDALKTLKP